MLELMLKKLLKLFEKNVLNVERILYTDIPKLENLFDVFDILNVISLINLKKKKMH